MVYSYNGILHMQKKELLISTAIWRTLPHTAVNERSQTQRVRSIHATQNSAYCCGV